MSSAIFLLRFFLSAAILARQNWSGFDARAGAAGQAIIDASWTAAANRPLHNDAP